MVGAVLIAVKDHHSQRRLEPRFGLFQQAFLEPARLRLLVLEDHDLVGGSLQQGVLGRLDRVGIAHLSGSLDAVCAQLLEHASEAGLRLPLGLVDVTQRMAESICLDRWNHHPQLDPLALIPRARGADLAH